MSARLLAICAVLAGLSGCALKPVQPWDKGELARSDMLMQGDGWRRASMNIFTPARKRRPAAAPWAAADAAATDKDHHG